MALDAEEAAFCRAVNDYRAANGLPPLMVSERLTNAAEWYSNDMAAKNYFNGDHTDSLGRGPYEGPLPPRHLRRPPPRHRPNPLLR